MKGVGKHQFNMETYSSTSHLVDREQLNDAQDYPCESSIQEGFETGKSKDK